MPRNPLSKGFSQGLLVARNANPRHSGLTKQEKKLRARIKDREATLAASKNDLSNSYHKPGSLQK